MEEGDDLLDHVNKVKTLWDQLACLEVPVREENIVMTLFESLLMLYKYLITALEMLPMKKWTMENVTAHLMHRMLKLKDNEPQYKDTMLLLRQSKANNPLSRQGVRTCLYHGKLGHIARFCYKAKNNEKDNVKNAKDNDEFTFATQHGAHSRSVCKKIMDSRAIKHITLHMMQFNIY